MAELRQRQVYVPSGAAAVEITDRFWPYEKPILAEPGPDLAGYLEQARHLLRRPACVRARFSPADEQLAANFHRRGITLTPLDRAIWLGCAPKYIALLKGRPPHADHKLALPRWLGRRSHGDPFNWRELRNFNWH